MASLLFYKKFQGEVAPILETLYNNILLSNYQMTKTMREGLITIIYKGKGDRHDLKNWRPISLLNLDYKILSRILADRVKYGINTIVNTNQTCGSKDRCIHDNILNIRTIIDFIKSSNSKSTGKIWLWKILQKWTKILYNGITSSVQVNGKITEKKLKFKDL